jgi:hypothetical protein
LAAAITTVGMGVLAPAAHAAAGDTTATFTITGGTLTITVPNSPVALSTVAAGSLTASGSLGSTSVSDQRGALVAAWTVTVSSTDFLNTTTGGTSAPEKVTKSNVSYLSGAATATTGTGTFTPTPTALSLSNPGTGAVWAGVGVNTASWNPTVAFILASNQVAGTYTGTLNQSVA